MPNASIVQLITLIVAIVLPLLGFAVNWGMWIRQNKNHQERIEKTERGMEHLMSGGVGGVTVFVSRNDCEENRERCRGEVTGWIEKHQDIVTSHSRCIRALENFARWFLTSKEGLPLAEVNKILTGNGGDK